MNYYIPTLDLSTLDSSLGISTVHGVELVDSVVCWRRLPVSELCLVADHYCLGRRPNSTEDAARI